VRKRCAINKKRTGFAFGELHEWIDMDAKGKGVDHRKERHYFNLKDQKTIKDYWDETKGKGGGEKAIVEWLFHIALGNVETAYRPSLKECSYGQNTYNCIEVVLKPRGYIDCDFKRLADEQVS